MSTVAQQVTEIIVNKLGVEESQVTPEASFTNDLNADSLDTVELIMEFERASRSTIPTLKRSRPSVTQLPTSSPRRADPALRFGTTHV